MLPGRRDLLLRLARVRRVSKKTFWLLWSAGVLLVLASGIPPAGFWHFILWFPGMVLVCLTLYISTTNFLMVIRKPKRRPLLPTEYYQEALRELTTKVRYVEEDKTK